MEILAKDGKPLKENSITVLDVVDDALWDWDDLKDQPGFEHNLFWQKSYNHRKVALLCNEWGNLMIFPYEVNNIAIKWDFEHLSQYHLDGRHTAADYASPFNGWYIGYDAVRNFLAFPKPVVTKSMEELLDET